jgi:hypothetical protein
MREGVEEGAKVRVTARVEVKAKVEGNRRKDSRRKDSRRKDSRRRGNLRRGALRRGNRDNRPIQTMNLRRWVNLPTRP